MKKNNVERASPDMSSTQFEYGLARFQSGYRAQITYKTKLGARFSIHKILNLNFAHKILNSNFAYGKK